MKVIINVNDKKIKLSIPPHERLIWTLRERLGLTGTKLGCGQGECGACTVLVDGEPTLSCLLLTAQVEGRSIVTIEGLEEGLISVMERAFIEKGAVQCGFCTPGMIMSAVSLLLKKSDPTEEEIKVAISGNLCRCTGYVKIVDAIREAGNYLKRWRG